MRDNEFNLFTIENWRDIAGYEGLYQVSTWGRVRSLDRWVNAAYDSMQLRKGRILKSVLNNYGYQFVKLSKDGKGKTYKIHRLVANAFIPNPLNLKEVNHINEVKTDNRAENLEWCDRSYNLNFGSRNQKASRAMTNGKLSKRVAQIDKNSNEVIKIWPSTMECGRNGFDYSSVSKCCRGERNFHHGFKWQYIE